MATTATVRTSGSLQRRRIIERPRLIGLLDESTARVRTLVAPAGYGKTTLAEQWVAKGGRQAAWCTLRRSSSDVAALALGLARAASALVEGCDVRLREHLRALPAPAENVDVLAEILAEDFGSWPSSGWLVLDEYHEIVTAPRAERFISALVFASPMQVLIASRERPSWVAGRSILYGEVLELGQTALAMDTSEAAEMLQGRSAASALDLAALAQGWPAVIGLASVSSAEIEGDDQVPESLYRFFAEEVFDALGPKVQAGLATLAVAPVLDRALAGDLLGAESADAVCTAALDVGVLVERGEQLELHPLARSFLEERHAHAGVGPARELVATCLARYRKTRDWDAAFDVIAHSRASHELEPLLLEALDDLLESARLPTIESWCTFAAEAGINTSAFAVARAEVALRYGRHAEAQAFGEAAALADPGSELTWRALSVAGRAAHLASREEEGFELYRRAEGVAPNEVARRDALWGQLICSIELELPEATSTLVELSAGVGFSSPREVVRSAAYGLSYQQRFGSLDLEAADRAREVLPAIADPLVETSFQSVYSSALAFSARYEEALEVASDLEQTARRYRLDFAVPYALCSAAIAHAGLRRWLHAKRCLDEAAVAIRATRDRYADQLCYAARIRLLAQEGKHRKALMLQIPELRTALASARAEVLGSRALVLASVGRVDEAVALIDEIRDSSRAVEPVMLSAAVTAIVALKRHDAQAVERVTELEEAACRTGAVDLLIAAYRSTPELLSFLLRGSGKRERVVEVVRRAGDEDLARAIGQPLADVGDPRQQLSPRERDVYDLLCRGLSNREIAALLFIAEGTVKAHAHHIYDKLGTRSRTALAVQAALERSDQATSATCDSDAEAAS